MTIIESSKRKGETSFSGLRLKEGIVIIMEDATSCCVLNQFLFLCATVVIVLFSQAKLGEL